MPHSSLHQSVLVTGGAGFIGRALVERLLEAGAEVTVLDLLNPKVHGPDSDGHHDRTAVRLRRADVRDIDAVTAAVEGAETVVHLAAETGVGESMYDVRHHVDVNVTGTATVLEAIARAGRRPRRLVVSSSRAVYGEGTYECSACGPVAPGPRARRQLERGRWDPPCPGCGNSCTSVPTSERAELQPVSVYGATKVAQEHLVHTMLPHYDVESVCLRYFNVYGPGQSLANPYTGILATFVDRARTGAPHEVYEDGMETRDFVFIDDVVEATMVALDVPAVGASAVNVGSGNATSLLRLAEAVAELVGSDSAVEVTGAFRAGDVRHATADVAHARAVLGHTATTPVATGLAKWVQWALASQPSAPGGAARARQELAQRGLYRLAR